VVVGVRAWVVDGHVHSCDQPAANERTRKADYLARRQAAIEAPVHRRHQLVVETVGVEMKPHPVDARSGQEGGCVVCGILDARSA
jgi:hypothetical protein